MSRELVCVVSAVNSSQIRQEERNGRPHLVVSSYTLPDNVIMNGGLYPADEIAKSYTSLERTYAPIGHPQIDGQYVSAKDPEALHLFHGGAFNRNVTRKDGRVHVEKWIDLEYAKNTERGRQLLEAIAEKKPIHTSTGVFLEREPAVNQKGYSWVARNMEFDHDAILIGEIGAATPEQGVGMMVNVADGSFLTEEPGIPARVEEWMQNILRKLGFEGINSSPKSSIKPQEAPEMDAKELAEALKVQGEQMAANFAKALEPIAASIATLATNQTAVMETLTANAKALEANKRAEVEKVLGKDITDGLTGNALDAAHAKYCGKGTPAPALHGNHETTGEPEKLELPD